MTKVSRQIECDKHKTVLANIVCIHILKNPARVWYRLRAVGGEVEHDFVCRECLALVRKHNDNWADSEKTHATLLSRLQPLCVLCCIELQARASVIASPPSRS